MTDVEAKANNKRKGHSGNQPANKKQKFGKNADGPKQKPGKKPKGNQDGVQNGAKAQQKQTQKPEKKMKQFAGTGEVQPKSIKQVQKNQQGNKSETDGEKKPKKSRYAALKGKINSGDKSVIETLDERIKAIQNRGELTKSAQRKLKVLQRMRRVATGEKVAVKESQQDGKQNKAVKGKGNQPKGKAVENAKAKAAKAKAKPAKTVTEESDEDDEFVEGATAGADSDDDEESGEEVEGESEAEDDNDDEDDDAEEDDDDAEEEDEDDESEEEEEVPKVVKQEKPKQNRDKATSSWNVKTDDLLKNELITKNQKRYVVFVGNIPYDTNNVDLKLHFEKCGNIKHIRIPTEKGSNKPRGFAYVEVENEETYQKCLSMHHSFLKSRRINVLYTQGGKKKGEEQKNKIKAKNFKLNAMRKGGQLLGSKKETQKRSFRRKKQREAVKTEDVE